MGFSNRVRLPIRVIRPQFPSVKTSFRDAAGNDITLSSVVRKTYELNTQWLPEGYHEKLAIALQHDNVFMESEEFVGGISQEGGYDVGWLTDQPNYPTAPAKATVQVTPFDASNSNCVSCGELSQVVLVDDAFPYIMNENATYTLDAIDNDSVCCYPVVFSITSFNSDYLDSATIDAFGIVTVHTKTGLVAANGIILVKYRATCENGGYDEAEISGNINGSIVGCLAPLDMDIINLTTTGFRGTWTPPSPVPDHYFWQVVTSPAGVVVQSGSTNALFQDITGLTPLTPYRFKVRSQCAGPLSNNADGSASNYISRVFTTNPVSPAMCGSYRIFPTAGSPTGTVTYLGCDGLYHTVAASLYTPITICALQTSEGAYTSITTSFTSATITYVSICGGTPTATLSFDFVNAGGFLQFGAHLSTPLDAPVLISKVFADGFSAPGCSGGAVSAAQKNSHMDIATGLYGSGAPPDTTSGSWPSASHYSIYNVIVGGVPVVNGSTQMIGSYLVTMIIPACV